MSKSDAESISFWIISTVASVLMVFVGPLLDGLTLTERFVATLIATPSFYLLFSVARTAVNRFRCRWIYGDWLYVTYSHEVALKFRGQSVMQIGDENTGFGRMTFSLSKTGDLTYRVNLFESLKDLLSTSDEKSTTAVSTGVATSNAIVTDEETATVHVLYSVRYHRPGVPARSGRLFMHLVRRGVMSGDWNSDINQETLSSGKMIAARPEKFSQLISEQIVR